MAIRQNTFLLKGSNIPGKIPSPGDLLLKEVALNFADVILYASGTTSNSILPIGWDRIHRTGDTMTGPLYTPILSATTLYGNGDNITGINTRLLYNDSSTGIIEFSGLSFTASGTTYNIAPIKAWFIDNTTNSLSPSRQYVEFSASSGNSLTGITGQNVTYIAINSGGTITQKSTPFTPTEQRTLIPLGVIVHSNRIFINAVNNQPVVSVNTGNQLYDLIESLNVFNVSGNTFSANGSNLNINKSEGYIFKQGVNFTNDNKNPHLLYLSALTAPSNIRYRLQNGSETSNTSVIDPNTYDNGITGTTVPDNKFTVQRIFLFQSNLIRIQYGQNIYDSIDDARAGISLLPYNTEQNLNENGLLRGFLILKKGTTNLNNINDAVFIEASRFGIVNETNIGSGLFRKEILNNASSGLLSGGNITILSSTGGTINISAGAGKIIDNTSNPNSPILTQVFWSATTGISITNLTGWPGTAIFVTSGGTFSQIDIRNLPSGADIRDKIFLGAIGHPNSALTLTFNLPNVIINPISQLNDFTSSIGPFSINGNKISKITGSLALIKSAGKSYMSNANYQTDRSNPSVLTISSLSGVTLSYLKQDAFLGGISPNISTSQYDLNGVLTLIPNNEFVAHRIWHQPSSNTLFFQYAQRTFPTLADARAGFGSETFIVPSVLEYGAYLVAIILVRQGETNLDNSVRSEIIPQGKFAGTGSGGGGIDTLQSSYNAGSSSVADIVIDSTRGSVVIQNGAGTSDNITNLIEGWNTGGTVTSFIRGNGGISGSSISATTLYGNGVNITGLSYLPLSGGTLTGQLISTNLTGTTSRMVEASSGGTISATREIVEGYGLSLSAKTLLEATSGWTINGSYSGATITGTYQGQSHYDDNYFYTAVADNFFIRLIRG